ncbi:carboxypeptidase [Cercophora samala]|uniref:Carboxypeptidase n=1 Tax=Cercophora samala TaxID=330535 RepID=A0AA40DHV2_9PEZI|nr:carboxypeptidase [Cercophora samala]
MRLISVLTFLLAAVEGLRTGRRNPLVRKGLSRNIKKVEKSTAAVFPGPQDKPFPRHRFLNVNSTRFAVNGTGIPEVDFDVGESYAGSLPVSQDPNEKSNLFFWFFPSSNKAAKKEIVIWFNGGPGCSSFEGLLQEHGPFLWAPGTEKPTRNPWSWHTLTNIVYVEQPVGTGFSTGVPSITNEEDLAAQFLGWWKNFVDTFGMQGYKVYIAGESYAGYFCPYIGNAMLNANDTTYYKLSGMLMNDVLLDNFIVNQYIPTFRFMEFYSALFRFADPFLADLKAADDRCGYSSYLDNNLIFPPVSHLPSPLPGVGENGTVMEDCATLWWLIAAEATSLNPCFDIYHVTSFCPRMYDPLGFLAGIPYMPPGEKTYFDRDDVKAAIHAPMNVTWNECSSDYVFASHEDGSGPSTVYALPNVIDKTQNVIIGHGQLDMLLPSNGTLLAIQNMTWGGKLGFQNRPLEPFYVPDTNVFGETNVPLGGAGVMGSMVSERGLTWVGVTGAGHMVPGDAPSAAYRQLEYLLGRVDCMNCTTPFTVEGLYFSHQIKGDLGPGTAPQSWSDKKPDDSGR